MVIKKHILEAVMSHYTAERDKALANIKIHLNNPVGVIELVHKTSEAQDALDVVATIVNNEQDN